MDNKKVNFLSTPRVGYSSPYDYRSRNVASTPCSKNSRLLPFGDIRLDDSLTTSMINTTAGNLTNRDKSTLYPQSNDDTNIRLTREFELLSLKFMNNKCTKLIEESRKQVDDKIQKSADLLEKKQNNLLTLSEEVEKKNLLMYLRENTDLVIQFLNHNFPTSHLNRLDDQLKRYRKILIPYLALFEIAMIKNADQINELLKMVGTPEFTLLLQQRNEIQQRQAMIDKEKAERNNHIYRFNNLAKQYIDLVEIVKCLDKQKNQKIVLIRSNVKEKNLI